MYVGWIYQWRYRASTGQQSVKLSLDALSFVIVVLMHWLIGFSAQKKEEKRKMRSGNIVAKIVINSWTYWRRDSFVVCRPRDIHRSLIPCNAERNHFQCVHSITSPISESQIRVLRQGESKWYVKNIRRASIISFIGSPFILSFGPNLSTKHLYKVL